MSYSRWSNSKWYTYWCVQDEETENYNTALFTVCSVKTFTAKKLRDALDYCISEVQAKCPSTDAEIDELKGYITRFLEDVEHAHGKVKNENSKRRSDPDGQGE